MREPGAPPLAGEPLAARVARAFAQAAGRPPAVVARAPGRVNLIGEHTDYNEGLVLPCAIDRDTVAAVAPRRDARVLAHALDLGETRSFDAAAPPRTGPGPRSARAGVEWIDYVQGVVSALAERGRAPGGFDLALASEVPRASGLSSSAALELAVVTALDAAFGLGLAPLERARVAHRAENGFVGVACGIMDPFASGLGRRGHALRIDCRTAEVAPVRMPPVALLVAHSGVERRLAAGGYNVRVEECRAALAAACEAGVAAPGARALRDLDAGDLPALEAALEPRLFRRARHVIRENARVGELCEALAAGERDRIGALLRASHASLRDDYEVSTPELDALCEIADALPGVAGSRLTGAGFGGCTLHWVEPEAADDVARALVDGFERRTGGHTRVWRVAAADGAAALAL